MNNLVGLLLLSILVGCAHSPPNALSVEERERNAHSFFTLLKTNQLSKAARFAQYYQDSPVDQREAQLLSQFYLNTCQPTKAWLTIQRMSDGNTSELYQAVVLTLVSTPRPWTKPILEGQAWQQATAVGVVTEPIRREVWRDEWSKLEFSFDRCEQFPVVAQETIRQQLLSHARELFSRVHEREHFANLNILALAMDTGWQPKSEHVTYYLQHFAAEVTNPYYQRLQILAHGQKVPTGLKLIKQHSDQVLLGQLHLHEDQVVQHPVQVPWLLMETE